MNKLLEKYAKTVLSLSIEYNPHKTVYSSIGEYIENHELAEDDFPYGDMQLCIENDCMWNLHCYPKTPIGFYSIYGHDLEILLNVITRKIKYAN